MIKYTKIAIQLILIAIISIHSTLTFAQNNLAGRWKSTVAGYEYYVDYAENGIYTGRYNIPGRALLYKGTWSYKNKILSYVEHINPSGILKSKQYPITWANSNEFYYVNEYGEQRFTRFLNPPPPPPAMCRVCFGTGKLVCPYCTCPFDCACDYCHNTGKTRCNACGGDGYHD